MKPEIRLAKKTLPDTLGKLKSTHGSRLVRWLGQEKVEQLSQNMRGWYGPPIAVHGVPGNVYATGDGDFIGPIRAGFQTSAIDRCMERIAQIRRGMRRALKEHVWCSMGFSSFSDLISEATIGGKRYDYIYSKTGVTGVANATSTLFGAAGQPAAGVVVGVGTSQQNLDSTTGGFLFTNPTSPDTQHLVAGSVIGSVAGNSLLLYDRLWTYGKSLAATGDDVPGSPTNPTRYQSTVGTALDYAGGNMAFPEVWTANLSATAHNWGIAAGSHECQYTDQGGATAQVMPVVAGVSGCIVTRFDLPTNTWFAPLAAGDVGMVALTRVTVSATIAAGAINWVIGHPLAWFPCPIANMIVPMGTSFNMVRIFDDACLALLEVIKPSTTATTYNAQFSAVAG